MEKGDLPFPPSDDRHQPADLPLHIFLTSIGEKQIVATDCAEWRYADPFRIYSRRNQLSSIRL